MVATCLPERKTSNTGIIYQTVSGGKKEETNAGTQKGGETANTLSKLH